jgi:nucleoredoxin
VYKIEDNQCSEAMIDKKFESFCGIMKFNKGTCAEQGFTQAHGTATVGVPMVGDIPVNLFAKELASEAFVKVFGDTLVQGQEAKSTRFALSGKGAVAIYFTAKWCRPCKHFLPQLRKAYKENLQGKGMEIVFVSLDHNQKEFDWYYEQMPWLAVPYADRDKELALVKEFGVTAIPRVIIYNPEGNVTTTDGKALCDLDPFGEKYPEGPWKKATSSGASTGLLALSLAHGMWIGLFVVNAVIFASLRFRHHTLTRKGSLLVTDDPQC